MDNDMNIFRKELDEAINGIACGFVWLNSPQGHEYWSEVHRNLCAIRDEKIKRVNSNVKENVHES